MKYSLVSCSIADAQGESNHTRMSASGSDFFDNFFVDVKCLCCAPSKAMKLCYQVAIEEEES